MNLSIKRISLFFFSLLTLASCEKPAEVGLNLQGKDQLGTYFDNKQPIVASTVVQPDSILAFKNNPILAGKYTDSELGTVSAAHYSEIGLNGTNVTFADAMPTADSLVLVLAYTGYYYGDTTSTITLNVHRLTENFVDDRTYFHKTKLAYNATPLGAETFKPRKNRVKVGSAVFSRLVRIPLSQTLANELLGKSGQSQFSSQAAFRNYFKGIVIVPEIASGNGAVIGLNTFPDSAGTALARVAGINLYYRNTAGVKKQHNFSFSGSYYYTAIEATHTGALAALKPNEEYLAANAGNKTFIQENTGVKTRLTFPNLLDFKVQNPNMVINYAELVLPVQAGSAGGNGVVLPPPSAVYFYESNANKRVRRTTGGVAYTIQRGAASAFGFDSPLRAIYNADSAFYKADVTSYVQALLTERKPNNGIIVSASPEDIYSASASGVSFPGTVSVNRALLNTSGNKSLKLRIYYSKIN